MRERRRWVLGPLLAAWGALAAPAAAQEAGPVSVVELVEAAHARHPALAAARAAAERGAAAVREARAARLPTLSADASATRFQEPMVVAPLHGFDPRNPPDFDRTLVQGSLSLGYTVFDGGARGARIGRAVALAGAAEAGVEASRQALSAEVVRAYLRLAAAGEVLEAAAARVGAVEQERARAALLLDQGKVPRVDLLRAEAALSAARAELVSAAAEADVARAELARLTGVDPAALGAVSTAGMSAGGAPPDAAEWAGRAVAASPELARLRGQVAAAERGRAEARSLWLPRVQLGGRYAEYGTAGGLEQGEWQGGVQLSYPVLTGGLRGAAAERTEAEVRGAQAELAAAELRVRAAVDAAAAAVEAARARTVALAAAVEQSAEVARIERLALDAGAGVRADYLAAEAELFRARAALSEARHAEIRGRVELARAAGSLSTDWIARTFEIRGTERGR